MCKCFSRVVLIAVNVLFSIVGAAIVGLSIWVLLSQSSFFNLVQLVTNDVNVDDQTLNNYMNSTSTLTAAAWILVVFGGLSLVVGLCGCIGAAAESKVLLYIYSALVIVILVAEIAGAIVAAVFKVQIGDELKPRLSTLESKHFLPLNLALANNTNNSASPVITAWINYVQASFGCCGITNQSDITANTTRWSQSSRVFNNKTLVVPVTCCPMKDTKTDLLAKLDWQNVENYLTDPNCPYTGTNSIVQGCYSKIDETINLYTWPLIAVGVIIGLCEILCVVMACGMIRHLKNSSMNV